MIARRVGLVMALLLFGSCSHQRQVERSEEDVLRFFSQGSIGRARDIGLMKKSALRPDEWDHMAAVYGAGNDMAFCQELVKLLNKEFPDEDYACAILND